MIGRIGWAWTIAVLTTIAVLLFGLASPSGDTRESLRRFDSDVRSATGELSLLAVQNNGRIKPLDSFARERLDDIFGERTFAGLSPTLVILSWALCPRYWSGEPIIKLEPGLDTDLSRKGAASEAERISPFSLRVVLQAQTGSRRDSAQGQGESRAWRRVRKRLMLFEALASDLRLVPRSGPQGWASPFDRGEKAEGRMGEMGEQPSAESADPGLAAFKSEVETLEAGICKPDVQQYNDGASGLAASLPSPGDGLYPPRWRLVLELYDNRIGPFRLLAIMYLAIAAAHLLGYLTNRGKLVSAASIALYPVAAFQVLAIGIRGSIAEKVMASNTYEYLLVMTAVTAIAALVLSVRFKEPAFICVGETLCGIGLAATILSPLSETITQLPPVLKSDWMTYHVGAAVLSYGVLYLAFGSAVAFLLCSKDQQSGLRSRLFEVNLRLVRLGFFLLGLGIITGAIWADKAWGRYWGWDPKESWSLITWCIYGIFLHLRLCLPAEKHRTILVLVSIVGFVAVLFTFIGVNYVLSGLHSYG